MTLSLHNETNYKNAKFPPNNFIIPSTAQIGFTVVCIHVLVVYDKRKCATNKTLTTHSACYKTELMSLQTKQLTSFLYRQLHTPL